jgi:hypothetical protein
MGAPGHTAGATQESCVRELALELVLVARATAERVRARELAGGATPTSAIELLVRNKLAGQLAATARELGAQERAAERHGLQQAIAA